MRLLNPIMLAMTIMPLALAPQASAQEDSTSHMITYVEVIPAAKAQAASLLKELAAAVADGNHIYAVIRGSAINNDGADKVSYTASSVAGQARAMIEALLIADASPDDPPLERRAHGLVVTFA